MKKRKSAKKTATKKPAKRKSPAKSKRAASSAGKRRATRAKATRAKKASKTAAGAKTARTSASRKKRPAAASAKRRGGSGRPADPREFGRGEVASNRAGQSGDIQGLSRRAGADSESVEELVDEGNAFEAGAIEGVERAGDSTREVRTRQVPEDDVPSEYLDED